jgi:hypothetical protein
MSMRRNMLRPLAETDVAAWIRTKAFLKRRVTPFGK